MRGLIAVEREVILLPPPPSGPPSDPCSGLCSVIALLDRLGILAEREAALLSGLALVMRAQSSKRSGLLQGLKNRGESCQRRAANFGNIV